MAAALSQLRSDLRQGSRLFKHSSSSRMRFGYQSDQPAIAVDDVRLRARQYQFHDLAAAQALDREAEMMIGLHVSSQR